jgi:hypothetical protein
MLFKRKTQTKVLADLDNQTLLKIYNALDSGKTLSWIFTKLNISYAHIEMVLLEVGRIEKEIQNHVREHLDCTVEDLVQSVSSEIIPTDMKERVVLDIVRWSDGKPDDAPSFEEYKATFVVEDMV